MVPPLPEGPVGEWGWPEVPHGTGTAESLAERGSRDKKHDQKGAGGGFTPRKRGGGASRARARTQCPDAALRQSGLNAGLGTGREKGSRD